MIAGKRFQHNGKYPLAFNLLVAEFKLQRAAGSKVSKLWYKKEWNWKLKHVMMQKKLQNLREAATGSRNSRKNAKWYWGEGPTRRNKSPQVDTKYRRWMPKNRYKINIDQVPLSFVNEQYKTYNTLGGKPVRVPQPSPGLDKQQATPQLCTRADGEQRVKPPLIFREKGHVATEEKEKYDKRVDMYFQ